MRNENSMKLEGLALIKDYRKNPDKYLPAIDHTEEVPAVNEYGERNIGWYAGLLEENRIFFAENWCVDHITMLTIFVSTKGIKDKTEEELIQWFQDIGYISFRNGNEPAIGVNTFKTKSGDEFYSINITVGIDDEPAQIDGAPVYGWAVLNEYNRRKKQ